MHRALWLCLLLAATPALAQDTFDHSVWDALLKKHVASGEVDYAGVRADRSKLDAYLKALGDADASKLSRGERYAFWLNAYNAFTFKGVLDHLGTDKSAWPSFSVTKVKGFWKTIKYRAGRRQLTLDQMEHEILRPEFKDARVHFGVVCASVGCPVLRAEAFTGAKVDQQLDEQTKLFFATPSKCRVDVAGRTIYINKIFEWFKGDFVRDEGSIAKYVARFHKDPKVSTALKQGSWTVKYVEYDWGLNYQR